MKIWNLITYIQETKVFLQNDDSLIDIFQIPIVISRAFNLWRKTERNLIEPESFISAVSFNAVCFHTAGIL